MGRGGISVTRNGTVVLILTHVSTSGTEEERCHCSEPATEVYLVNDKGYRGVSI